MLNTYRSRRSGGHALLMTFLALPAAFLLLGACSIQDYAIEMVSDALTGDGSASVFLEENDPQLVGDALPFAIKLYETLLAENPGHPGLTLTTGSLYVMYANAFLQTPALYLPLERYDERIEYLERAKNLYLRGKDFMLEYLDGRYPGFAAALEGSADPAGLADGEIPELEEMLSKLDSEDVAYAYWLGAGWFGAVSIDSFDLALAFRIPSVLALLEQASQIEPEFNNGAIHELLIQVYASIPEGMGGSREKAVKSFSRAVEIQQGRSASPYVSLATSVALPAQDFDWFIELMNAALAIDPDDFPELRLMNTLSRQQARWYLDHIGDFFI
jgi:predicted anti-sigma-YlaC factor YlaD